MRDQVRFDIRVGKQHEEWLQVKMEETGMSRSALIMLCINNEMEKDRMIKFAEFMQQVEQVALEKVDALLDERFSQLIHALREGKL